MCCFAKTNEENISNLFMQRWDFDSFLFNKRILTYDIRFHEIGEFTGNPYIMGIINTERSFEYLYAYTSTGVVFNITSLNSFVVDDRRRKAYALVKRERADLNFGIIEINAATNKIERFFTYDNFKSFDVRSILQGNNGEFYIAFRHENIDQRICQVTNNLEQIRCFILNRGGSDILSMRFRYYDREIVLFTYSSINTFWIDNNILTINFETDSNFELRLVLRGNRIRQNQDSMFLNK